MKYLWVFLFTIYIQASYAQITNVKAGVWSDNTVWSSNAIPGNSDRVLLNFDIIVDINATCKSLTLNGNNVTVNQGITLAIAGDNAALNTDTSVLFTKKTYYYFGQPNPADSSIQIFKNNTIDGTKGYIINTKHNQFPSSTSTFKYNNFGQLIEILTSEVEPSPGILSTVHLTWNQGKIIRIKWEEPGSYGMDRHYNYSTFNDTLLIRYAQSLGRNYYLDSAAVTIFTDTGLNKIYRMYKGGEFDYTNVFSDSKGVFYNERSFHYTANNITSVKYYGETFYNITPHPYSIEADSAVCFFTRDSQVSTFLPDIEESILGKEFKLLCYDQTDSVSWIRDNYFTSGDWLSNSNYERPQQDFYQSGSVFNNSLDPVTEAKINYDVRKDGIITEQKTGDLYKKLVYTLDLNNRIILVREYNTLTNDLVTMFQFIYP